MEGRVWEALAWPAPTQRGGLVVLMHPAEQARYSSARLTLVGWLAADAVAVAVMLWETADRLQSGRLVTACVLGLLGWALAGAGGHSENYTPL